MKANYNANMYLTPSDLNEVEIEISNKTKEIQEKIYNTESSLRTIRIGDDLSGKLLVLSFPYNSYELFDGNKTLVSSPNYEIRYIFDSKNRYRIDLYDNDKRSYFLYARNGSNDNPYLNYVRYRLPDDFGTVYYIDSSDTLFKYIQIYEDESVIPDYELKNWESNEFIYMQDIDRIEQGIENIGKYYNKPLGWITTKDWFQTGEMGKNIEYGVGTKSLSYQDINRWITDLNLTEVESDITLWNTLLTQYYWLVIKEFIKFRIFGKSKQEISSQSANIFAMSDKTYRSHNVTCIKEYIFDGYNSITIKGIGGATYQQICFDIPSSLLEEGVTYYLGGMVESFTSPSTYAQIGINEVEISTGTRTAYAEANFTSSELNTNKSTSMTIQDLDTYRYDIRLYLTTNRAGTTDDTLSVVYKNLYLSKNNEYVDFVPNMPSPDYPSEIKTVKGIRNLFDGINQNYYLNITVNLAGLATGNNGLVIPTNGKTTFTISTNIVQERYRVACINNLLQEEKSTTTAYNGVNKDGTNASITIDTTGYSYLIINATNLDSIMIEEGPIAHDYVPYGSWLEVKDTGKNYLKPINDYVWSNNGNTTIEKIDNYMKINMPKSPYHYSGIYMKNYDNEKEQFASTVNELNGQECIYSFYAKADSERTIYFQCSDSEKIYITLTTEWQRYSKIIPNMTTNQVPTFYCGTTLNTTSFYIKDIMLQKGSTATEYEPYKEQSTLIDMNKPNLFDKDNANILNAYFNGNTGLLVGDSSTYLTYIPCKPNTTYNIQKIISSRFAIYISADIPKVGGAITYVTGNANVNNLQFTTNSDANYLIIYYYKSDVDTLTEQEILDSIKIYEGIGTDDYYELSSMNDIKDILTIQNGQANINQKIGKIVLDGSENWDSMNTKFGIEFRLLNLSFKLNSSKDNVPNIISDRFIATTPDMMWNNVLVGITIATTSARILISLSDTSITTVDEFKTWLSENPVTVYYELAEPQTISLNGSYDIELFNGINNITTNDELQPSLEITLKNNKTEVDEVYEGSSLNFEFEE